eukprot:m.175373 g.175373  ORF g.175373 m.175373 type:complete len:274 (+) comp31815_c0_seq1:270-1091(+)
MLSQCLRRVAAAARPHGSCQPIKQLANVHRKRLCLRARQYVTSAVASKVSMLSRLNQFTAKHPLVVSVGIAMVKTSLVDLIVQTMHERKKWAEIDWNRNLLFTSFGFWYCGIWQYGVYVIGFARLFPRMGAFAQLSIRAKLKDVAGLKMLAGQVALDILVINPVLYWPTFYLFKSMSFRDPDDTRTTLQIFSDTLTVKYPQTFLEDNFGMGFFWIPANIIIFSCPIHLRMPINHLASGAWCFVLSIYRGANDPEETDAVGEESDVRKQAEITN